MKSSFFILLFLAAHYIIGSGTASSTPGYKLKVGWLRQKGEPLEGMHPQAQLNFVRKKIKNRETPFYPAYQQLVVYADSAFQHTTHELADFSVPGYYVDPAGHRKNSLSLQTDAFDAYACALAYRLGAGEKYAKRSLQYLNSWAAINTGYSQADGPLVMTYSGTAMIMAGQLLYDYKDWRQNDREQFGNWVKRVYRKAANEIRSRKNNWADWGRFGSILSACYLQDLDEVHENIRLIKSDLADKIAEDGHMPHETVRGANGIWYTYFSLAPLTAAMWVAYNATGENLFNYTDGEKSVKKALDYLYYFNLHPEEWKWFKNPNKGPSGKWPSNLLEAVATIYNEPLYEQFALPARPIIYNFHHFAWTFPTLMKVQIDGSK